MFLSPFKTVAYGGLRSPGPLFVPIPSLAAPSGGKEPTQPFTVPATQKRYWDAMEEHSNLTKMQAHTEVSMAKTTRK